MNKSQIGSSQIGYKAVKMGIMGRIKEILYVGDLETCKYVADCHHNSGYKVMVIYQVRNKIELQYAAN